ncbi:MAG: tetratricopeptide repeat protein [Deltaproteobacteria bacterium]|nr:tetratricopeptide repeat protein [Deltaproteobacteria bacterium]
MMGSRSPMALVVVCCALVSILPAASRADVRVKARQVEQLLDDWRLTAAEKSLEELERSAPANPYVKRARARVLFHHGDHARAAVLLQQIVGEQSDPDTRYLARLVSSTAKLVRGYVQQRSAGGHFLLRAAPGPDELLIPFAAETLEAARDRLLADLGHAPKHTVVVEIYGQPKDLARVSPLTEEDIRRTGTIALCKYQRLMIVSPRALPRGYGWRDTLAHEYAHLVVSQLTHDRTPIWLHEGIAKYFEARWRAALGAAPPLAPAQRHLLAQALAQKKLIPFAKMHPSMAKLPDQRSTALAFAQVQTAVDFLAGKRRNKPLKRLLLALREGATVWEAVRRISGLSKHAFQSAWRVHLEKRGLKPLPGLTFMRRNFGEKKSKEQRIAAIKRKRVRRYFRLADMLRRRKLTRAAVLEYHKAHELSGRRDAFIGNALARAKLEIGDPHAAIAALLPVIEYYPELAGVQTTLGLAYLRAGDRRHAVEHLKVALRINPFTPEVHCGLANASSESAEVERFRAICRQLGGGGSR